MKKPVHISIALLAFVLVVGVGIGWIGSHWTSGAPPVPSIPRIEMGPALDAALAEGSTSLRLIQLVEALEHLDASNRDSMLEVIEREKSVLSDLELRVIFDAWARFEPEAAIAHPGNEKWVVSKRKVAMDAAIESWALRDPEAARRFVDTRLAGAPRLAQYLVEPLVGGWAASGLPGALEYIREIPTHLRPAATVSLVTTRARMVGVEELLRWADENVGVGDPKFQRDFFGRVAKAASRRDPAVTADWVSTHFDQEYGAQGPRLVAQLWFPQDPDSAFAWISKEVPEEIRFETAALAPRDWLAHDIDLLGDWLESQSLEPLHDAILERYASKLATRGRDEAIVWAELIQDDQLRADSLKTVARHWYQREPEAALAWVEESSLDDAARASIREAPESSRRREKAPPKPP